MEQKFIIVWPRPRLLIYQIIKLMLHDFPPLQIQPRRYFQKLPLQANFYPMPTTAYIQDSQYRLTLHTAQALGASSLASGELGSQILMLR